MKPATLKQAWAGTHLFLYGDVEPKIINQLIAEIEDCKNGPIMLHISSFGGYAYCVFLLLAAMRRSKFPVHTVVDGLAFSAGGYIFLGGVQRFVYPHSVLLFHQTEQVFVGKTGIREHGFDHNRKLVGSLNDFVISLVKHKSTLSSALIKKVVLADSIITSDWAVANGIATGIIEKSPVRKGLRSASRQVNRKIILDVTWETADWAKLILGLEKGGTDSLTLKFGMMQQSPATDHYVIRNLLMACSIPVIAWLDSYLINEELFMIYVACQKRIMAKDSFFAIQLQFYSQASLMPSRTQTDLVSNRRKYRKLLFAHLEKYTKLTRSLIDKMIAQPLVFKPEEALAYGLCDEVY